MTHHDSHPEIDMSKMTDEEARDFVEGIMLEIKAEERRNRWKRGVVIFFALLVAWMCGAMCATQAVGA